MASARLWTLQGNSPKLVTCDLLEWAQQNQYTVTVKRGNDVLLVETFPTRDQALRCAGDMYNQLLEQGWTTLN